MIQTGNTVCFRPYPLEEALRGLAEAGFVDVELGAVKGYIEHLDPDRLSPQVVADAKASLARYGLHAVSVSGHTEVHLREGLERSRRILDAAAELGVLTLSTYTRGVETPADRGAFMENVRALADEAEAVGIRLCLEIDSSLLRTAKMARVLLADINHPWIALNYDPANAVLYGGADPEEDIEHALPVLGHVHLKDKRGGIGVVDFPPLGEGDLDVRLVLERLEASRFDGPVSMEIEFDGTWPAWEECVAAARRGKSHWDALAARMGNGRATV
jgi:L-ribulose-5-phosphate 3-epimerase